MKMKKDKIIVYALGKVWKEHKEEILEKYEIIACTDRDKTKAKYCTGLLYIVPEEIEKYEYDYILIGNMLSGMRERLAIDYGINPLKIRYYDEHMNIKQYSDDIDKIKLTVIIPTYNRKNRLIRTMTLLDMQTDKEFDVIVLDNNSDYNIEECIKKCNFKLREVRINKNIFNIGMHGNLANIFLQQKDGWIWTLSDDDIPSIDAVAQIKHAINKKKRGDVLHFSINRFDRHISNSSVLFNNLDEMCSFYAGVFDDKAWGGDVAGDLIYLSNKVFSIERLSQYYSKAFQYAYTGIPQIIPALFMLNEHAGSYELINSSIISYDLNEGDHWDWEQVALGLATITDINFNINHKNLKILYKMYMIDNKLLVDSIQNKDKKYMNHIMEKLHERIYKYME